MAATDVLPPAQRDNVHRGKRAGLDLQLVVR
jgi:hypothetical protein